MAADRRTDVDIRRDIASEREGLVEALAELRAGITSKRRAAKSVAGIAAAGVAAAASLKILRRIRS